MFVDRYFGGLRADITACESALAQKEIPLPPRIREGLTTELTTLRAMYTALTAPRNRLKELQHHRLVKVRGYKFGK